MDIVGFRLGQQVVMYDPVFPKEIKLLSSTMYFNGSFDEAFLV